MRRLPTAVLGLLGSIALCGASALTAQSTLVDLVLVDDGGRPLARQDVALVAGDATGAGFPATALQKPLLGRTDDSGHCVFAVPRFDLYWLRVGGVEAVHDAWPLLPDDARQQLPIAAPASIEVVDALADERPAGSELRVMVRSLMPDGAAAARRGRGDRLAFSRLRPGKYVVAMVVDGHRYTQHTVTLAAGQTLRCTLYPADGVAATGRVTDASGAPVAGARLFGSPNSLLDVTTDADGRFDLGRCGGMAMRRAMLQTADGGLQQIALADLLAAVLADDGEVRHLELLSAPLAESLVRVQRRDRAPLIGLRALQLHIGHRLALEARPATDVAWSLRCAVPKPEHASKVSASPPEVLVLADGCALATRPVAGDEVLELDPGVTRVLRLPRAAAEPAAGGVRWLTVRQMGVALRRVPICRDGRVLVSHLAVAGVEWEDDDGPSRGTELDERPFAELDLR